MKSEKIWSRAFCFFFFLFWSFSFPKNSDLVFKADERTVQDVQLLEGMQGSEEKHTHTHLTHTQNTHFVPRIISVTKKQKKRKRNKENRLLHKLSYGDAEINDITINLYYSLNFLKQLKTCNFTSGNVEFSPSVQTPRLLPPSPSFI